MPKFEPCESYEYVTLPKRSTQFSAGYDFYCPEDVVLPSVFSYLKAWVQGKSIEPVLISTHVKAIMDDNEVLFVFNRSSNPRRGLILANGVGVIDKDYADNPDNDGDIGFAFYNLMPWEVTVKKGQKIGQGVFVKYEKTDNDTAQGTRTGGFGSTGE